jgi:hypothetical protein
MYYLDEYHTLPTRSRFPMVFLGPRANVKLVPKFHDELQSSHAALPMLNQNFTPMQPSQR